MLLKRRSSVSYGFDKGSSGGQPLSESDRLWFGGTLGWCYLANLQKPVPVLDVLVRVSRMLDPGSLMTLGSIVKV